MNSFLRQIEDKFELYESTETSKAAMQSAIGKNRDDWEYKICNKCKSLTSHIKDECQRCEKNKTKFDTTGIVNEKTDDEPEQLNDSNKCMHCEGTGCDHCDNLKEMSTTAGVPAPPHKFAFGDKDKKKKIKYPGVAEALDRKYERIIESYRKFANGNSKLTPETTVKNTIKEVSKKLKEIEELVRYSSKLKTESGMTRDGYGPRVENALNKISERLIKISERVRSLGE